MRADLPNQTARLLTGKFSHLEEFSFIPVIN
jgi:hypothetical protein